MITEFQKKQWILALVNNWVRGGYNSLISAEAELAAQRVRVDMEKAAEREEVESGGFGWAVNTHTIVQEEQVATARKELELRQEVQKFAIETFLQDGNSNE